MSDLLPVEVRFQRMDALLAEAGYPNVVSVYNDHQLQLKDMTVVPPRVLHKAHLLSGFQPVSGMSFDEWREYMCTKTPTTFAWEVYFNHWDRYERDHNPINTPRESSNNHD